MHKCITTVMDSSLSDLFTTSQSPSHIELCRFKVTVLAPLQWGHQTLSSSGFLLPIPNPPICALPFACDPSPTIFTAFALDLKSAYEKLYQGEHTIFGRLSLANLA
jgi:hypothetical protein